MPHSPSPELADLRFQIARLERGDPGRHGRTVLPFEDAGIDAALPGWGLACGAMHELAGAGADTEHAAVPALMVGVR